MNNEVGDVNPDVEDEEFDEFADDDMVETVVLPETDLTDNVGDASVEINVEQLIADIEGTDDEVSARKKEIRRRLEEMAEEKSFEDTYAIEFEE
jgi:hypothetical protein